MRINIIILSSFIITNTLFGQDNDSLGLDYNPQLTIHETEYFNKVFIEQLNDFDFTDKKIGFVFKESIFLTNKNHYFKLVNNKEISNEYILTVLTANEQNKSGGYNALIVICDKVEPLKEKKRIKIIEAFSEREKSIPDNLYKLGLDNSSALTYYESEYFDTQFKGKDFDFKNKKIGFFFGNYGSSIQTKKEYFNRMKERLSHNYSASMDMLLILSEEQKVESSGFDAIIVTWSKILVKSATPKMIKKLKKNVAQ